MYMYLCEHLFFSNRRVWFGWSLCSCQSFRLPHHTIATHSKGQPIAIVHTQAQRPSLFLRCGLEEACPPSLPALGYYIRCVPHTAKVNLWLLCVLRLRGFLNQEGVVWVKLVPLPPSLPPCKSKLWVATSVAAIYIVGQPIVSTQAQRE